MRISDWSSDVCSSDLAITVDGFITVGDVGHLDGDGYLYLGDRRRDMIISGGVNIYPAEIEAALVALDEIADCAVFGVPDEEFGEAVCAYLAPRDGFDIDQIGRAHV